MALVFPKLIPSLAVMMSNIQMASPLRAVLICRKHNSLGSLNPIPWAVALLNCMGYMLYGCINGDPYVMASVTLGIPINYFAVSSALGILGKSGKVSDNDTSWRLDCIILGGAFMWIVIAFTIGTILPLAVSGEQKDTVALAILGYFACATCMFYYFSPLTALKEIVRTKDAAGLYTPMIVMNLITSVMWALYGFVFIGDVVVYGPNMFAVFLSAVQLGIKCYYPSIDASKLQRKLTVVEMRDDFGEGDEEAKEAFVDAPRPLRGRAGTLTQNIVCGDGTVGVIAFSEEEVVARNHRSNTLTSVTELVLDNIDLIGPRRHPADVVEVHPHPSPSPEDHFPTATRTRASRAVSFSSVPMATLVPMVPISPRQRSVASRGSGTGSGSGGGGGGPLPVGQASPARGRRRTQSLTEVLPQIVEEGRATSTADEEPAESYSYGGAASSSPGSSSPRRGNAPLLATGTPLSSGHNAGAGLLHVLSEAMQGRSRTTSRATSYDPLDEEGLEV